MTGYAQSFEGPRRIKPRLWNADYVLLRGLADNVRRFASTHGSAGVTVVDFGCGAKPYRPLFPDGCCYIGVDTGGNPHADVQVNAEGKTLLPDGTADLLLSTQVIYLILDYERYLRECRRLLKPNGCMLLTTHGTWTYHPASGGDYYRFTQDGLRHVLRKHGFEVVSIDPVVGTLGTGLHLRQLVFNSWLKRVHLGWLAAVYNVVCNLRIMLEDGISPRGTRMAAPVILCAIARPI